MATFFTSDTHFTHKNILKHCPRPFSSIEEMDEGLVSTWNQTVAPDDTIYHVGDFGWKKSLQVLPRLNGIKHLITGNHDPDIIRNAPEWTSVQDYMDIKIKSYRVILFHYPIMDWNAKHYGSLHFHGHMHGSIPDTNQRCDVGIDSWNMKPVSFEQILEHLRNQDTEK